MKKTTAFLLASGFMAAVTVGCKKSGSAGPATPTWTPGIDIYFVGGDFDTAVYWKNGIETKLGPGGGGGIAVNGSTVCITGAAYPNSDPTKGPVIVLALWEDGVETDFPGWASVGPPVVAATDVYVPGALNRPAPSTYPVYWKDGQMVYLDSIHPGAASNIVVNASDVYAMGVVGDTGVVWKNGERLNDAADAKGPFSQILISGGNLYVLVQSGGYFVNTISTYVPLPEATLANGIFLDGSDIYVAGTIPDSAGPNRAAYWKDGALHTLPNYNGTTYSTASSIVVAGSDVYVAGYATVNNIDRAVYWKNGIEWTLANYRGYITGAVLGN